MEGNAQKKCVERCSELAHNTGDQLHKVFHSLFRWSPSANRREIVGELSELCTQIGLTCLYLARIGRPGSLWTVNYLTTSVTKVELSVRSATRTSHHLHSSHIQLQTVLPRWESSNRLQTLIIPRRRCPQEIWLSQSQTQVVLCWYLDRIHLCHFHGLKKKHRAVSDSSTEAEIISLDTGLRIEGMPALNLWDRVIDISFPNCRWLQACSSNTNTNISWSIWRHWLCTSKRAIIQHANGIEHFRRQRSCNKEEKQRQKSCNASYITRTSCRLGLSLWPHELRSNVSDQLRQHKTAFGRHSHKRIIHRGQMDKTDTTGQHHDAHHTHSKQLVSLFCGCESFIFPAWANVPENLSLHRQARNKSHFIAQRCLRGELTTRMPTWTIAQYFHQITKLEATLSVKTCVSKIFKHSPWRLEHYHDPRWW